MAYATLDQCFHFLARNNGTISLAPKPDDPCTIRCAVRVGDNVAAVEYDATEQRNLVTLFLGKVCAALEAQVENGS